MIEIAEIERSLVARGYVAVHETEKKRGYKLDDALPLYVNRMSKNGVTAMVVHPSSVVPQLSGKVVGLTVAKDYYHSSNMKLFPKRRHNGKGEIGYGWGLTFETENALIDVLNMLASRPLPSSEQTKSEPEPPNSPGSVGGAVSDALLIPITLAGRDEQTLSTYRIGHSNFKRALVDYWGACAVTGLTAPQLLRASHIKPWIVSSPIEKTDHFNGLLLAPHLDAAFDAGCIGFTGDGTLMRSKSLSTADAEALGFSEGLRLRRIDARHVPFLVYHREVVFVE